MNFKWIMRQCLEYPLKGRPTLNLRVITCNVKGNPSPENSNLGSGFLMHFHLRSTVYQVVTS
jgi:hypothetical protein